MAEEKDAQLMADAIKIAKYLRNSEEKKTGLAESNENLLLEKLSKIQQKRNSAETRSCFFYTRWTIYIFLWILGIVYLTALNHRGVLCSKLI